MRLWHKYLIKSLPREQLVAQWRECSAIAGNLLTKGTPNHILVNKILDYPRNHFISYSYYIREEMKRRGYRTMDSVWNKIFSTAEEKYELIPLEELYPEWHNEKYIRQCIYNLEEKYDCGGVKEEDFSRIIDAWKERYMNV